MYYRIYIDKNGEGWKAYGSCLSEATTLRLRDWALSQGWAVKVERMA